MEGDRKLRYRAQASAHKFLVRVTAESAEAEAQRPLQADSPHSAALRRASGGQELVVIILLI